MWSASNKVYQIFTSWQILISIDNCPYYFWNNMDKDIFWERIYNYYINKLPHVDNVNLCTIVTHTTVLNKLYFEFDPKNS